VRSAERKMEGIEGRGRCSSHADCELLRHCRMSPNAQAIVTAWSARSGIEANEMTVNVVHGQQGGNGTR
jgi:hypothetical protein